ncbi:hypothetical protein Patl1_01313 [Pistacia atlantica]|uniref:Uncharacterized protein n=1 Tax=Pistacia atlantica TaxID=434234 RepID=A0ACC1C773_9ROSI|nr:hypothetical protein Patl1_01313 [Pistacia atlantica]
MEVTSEKSGNYEPYKLPYHDTDERDDIITHQAALALPKPNQEFYNFDNDRRAELFRAGQIWAAHCKASVPHRYALINSNNNFDLIVTWLKPQPVSPNDKRWSFSGLPVGSGSFDLSAEFVCLMKRDGFRRVFERETIERSPIVWQIPSNYLYSFSHNIPAFRLMGGDGEKVKVIFELDQLALPDAMVDGIDAQITLKKKNINVSSHFTPPMQLPSQGLYPESKFLKLKWTPNDFSVGQPHPVLGHDIEWKKKNLPIACGIFELCKTNTILELSYVSIPIEHQRFLLEPYFIIYPKEEFSNENGMTIAKLVKVENHVTYFQRQQDNGFEIVRFYKRRC